jgi:hypothetical protein
LTGIARLDAELRESTQWVFCSASTGRQQVASNVVRRLPVSVMESAMIRAEASVIGDFKLAGLFDQVALQGTIHVASVASQNGVDRAKFESAERDAHSIWIAAVRAGRIFNVNHVSLSAQPPLGVQSPRTGHPSSEKRR